MQSGTPLDASARSPSWPAASANSSAGSAVGAVWWARCGAWLIMCQKAAFTAWHMGDPDGCRVARAGTWPELLTLMRLAQQLALADLTQPRPGLSAYVPHRPAPGSW